MVDGPVDVVVLGFEGNRFRGDIIPALDEILDRSLIRILDLVFVTKDEDGSVESFEIEDAGADMEGVLAAMDRGESGLLSDSDVSEIGELLQPNSSAAMIAFEQTWLNRLRGAVLGAGGHIISSQRIPPEVVELAAAAAVVAEEEA